MTKKIEEKEMTWKFKKMNKKNENELKKLHIKYEELLEKYNKLVSNKTRRETQLVGIVNSLMEKVDHLEQSVKNPRKFNTNFHSKKRRSSFGSSSDEDDFFDNDDGDEKEKSVSRKKMRGIEEKKYNQNDLIFKNHVLPTIELEVKDCILSNFNEDTSPEDVKDFLKRNIDTASIISIKPFEDQAYLDEKAVKLQLKNEVVFKIMELEGKKLKGTPICVYPLVFNDLTKAKTLSIVIKKWPIRIKRSKLKFYLQDKCGDGKCVILKIKKISNYHDFAQHHSVLVCFGNQSSYEKALKLNGKINPFDNSKWWIERHKPRDGKFGRFLS